MENSARDSVSLRALPAARLPLPHSASSLSAPSSENLLELLGPSLGLFFLFFPFEKELSRC